MGDYTLRLNDGSSSLKFFVYRESEGENWRPDSLGLIEGIGTSPRIFAKDAEDQVLVDRRLDGKVLDGRDALHTLAEWLGRRHGGARVLGVRHRVVCMGTRPGALDPGVVLYLFQSLRLSVAEVETILYRKSCLLGTSGVSGDMRELLQSSDPGAGLAVEYIVYRAAKEIGASAAVLGGIDGLVFTAGIEENSTEIRRRICEASARLGIEVDAEANAQKHPWISRPDSKVSTWVIATNEELVIARHTGLLLGLIKAMHNKKQMEHGRRRVSPRKYPRAHRNTVRGIRAGSGRSRSFWEAIEDRQIGQGVRL